LFEKATRLVRLLGSNRPASTLALPSSRKLFREGESGRFFSAPSFMGKAKWFAVAPMIKSFLESPDILTVSHLQKTVGQTTYHSRKLFKNKVLKKTLSANTASLVNFYFIISCLVLYIVLFKSLIIKQLLRDQHTLI